MQISELNQTLVSIVSQLNAAHDEIVAKQTELNTHIASLEASLSTAGEIPADAAAAIDSLKTATQALDDIVPAPAPVDPAPAA